MVNGSSLWVSSQRLRPAVPQVDISRATALCLSISPAPLHAQPKSKSHSLPLCRVSEREGGLYAERPAKAEVCVSEGWKSKQGQREVKTQFGEDVRWTAQRQQTQSVSRTMSGCDQRVWVELRLRWVLTVQVQCSLWVQITRGVMMVRISPFHHT